MERIAPKRRRSCVRAGLYAVTALLIWIGAPLANAQTDSHDRAAQAFRQLRRADETFRGGAPLSALALYRNLLKKFPTWYLAMCRVAVARMELFGPSTHVLRLLDKAFQLRLGSPYPAFLLSLYRLENNPSSRALGTDSGAHGASDSGPLADRLAFSRALAYEKIGRLEEAAKEYRELVAGYKSGRCGTAGFRLVKVLERQGWRNKAADLLESLVNCSLNPARWRKKLRELRLRDGP